MAAAKGELPAAALEITLSGQEPGSAQSRGAVEQVPRHSQTNRAVSAGCQSRTMLFIGLLSGQAARDPVWL